MSERYLILLKALPSSYPAHVRLKRFLKAALRAYALRAERIEQLPDRADKPATHPAVEAEESVPLDPPPVRDGTSNARPAPGNLVTRPAHAGKREP